MSAKVIRCEYVADCVIDGSDKTENRLKLYFAKVDCEGADELFSEIVNNRKGGAKFVITLGNQTKDRSDEFKDKIFEGINCYTFSMKQLGADKTVYDAITGRTIGQRAVASLLTEEQQLELEKQRFSDRIASGDYTYTKPTSDNN